VAALVISELEQMPRTDPFSKLREMVEGMPFSHKDMGDLEDYIERKMGSGGRPKPEHQRPVHVADGRLGYLAPLDLVMVLAPQPGIITRLWCRLMTIQDPAYSTRTDPTRTEWLTLIGLASCLALSALRT